MLFLDSCNIYTRLEGLKAKLFRADPPENTQFNFNQHCSITILNHKSSSYEYVMKITVINNQGFLRSATILSVYRDGRKATSLCIWMVVAKEVSTVF